MRDKIFLDTNILVYLANEDSAFHQSVKKQYESLLDKYELWISRQVLREYAVVMTRPGFIEKPLDSETVLSDMQKWSSLFQVADETEIVTTNLMSLIQNYNISGKRIHDTNIAATMMSYSISILFTLNTDDFKIFKELQLLSLDEDKE